LTSAQIWLNTPQVGYAMLGKVRTRYVGHPDKVFGFSPVFLLFNPVPLDTSWTSFGHSLDTTLDDVNLG